jgi:outer membrane protein assembly factor BamB/tRNA A-37 threonylcarbamoyl transferase component Bud32
MGPPLLEKSTVVTDLDTRRIANEEGSTASRPEGTLPPGTVLQERYKTLSVQGVGGMGAVYRSRDLRFSAVEKIIAVKEMVNTIPDPRLRRIGIQNFEREANILAGLSHPAIPKIFDYFTEGNRSYLVLEFVEGQTLESILEARRHPCSQEEAVDWGLQICDVLAYLHNHKPPVIFRDIKPGNLMLRPDGRVMVIDFGIAKVFEHGQRGTMIGTEGYSPPEQYRGAAEPRGDLYALCATLHHLLTGRDPRLEPPFTFHERPIREFNPAILPEVEAVIMKSLSYDVQERFASANELANALANALPHRTRRTGILDVTGSASSQAMPQDVNPVWVFKCEDEVRSSPRVADGLLYIGSYDHNLYALDAQEGAFKWKCPAEGGIASTPCIHEDLLLVGSEDGKFYAISRELGTARWTVQTKGCVRSSAQVQYGHVFFGSDDGCLYAVNVETGRMIWRFESAGPIRSTPLIVNELIYIGSDDGYIYAIEMRSGNQKWRYNTNRRVTSSAAWSENLIFIGSADGSLYALNARSGWPVWRLRTKGYVFSSPTVDGETVYVGSADSSLYAADIDSGRELWRYESGGPITSSPAVSDNTVYVGSNDGALHAVDARRGRGLWQYVTGGPIASSPLVSQGLVYVGSTDHAVYALPV